MSILVTKMLSKKGEEGCRKANEEEEEEKENMFFFFYRFYFINYTRRVVKLD